MKTMQWGRNTKRDLLWLDDILPLYPCSASGTSVLATPEDAEVVQGATLFCYTCSGSSSSTISNIVTLKLYLWYICGALIVYGFIPQE